MMCVVNIFVIPEGNIEDFEQIEQKDDISGIDD
jgi:hypothetical protein